MFWEARIGAGARPVVPGEKQLGGEIALSQGGVGFPGLLNVEASRRFTNRYCIVGKVQDHDRNVRRCVFVVERDCDLYAYQGVGHRRVRVKGSMQAILFILAINVNASVASAFIARRELTISHPSPLAMRSHPAQSTRYNEDVTCLGLYHVGVLITYQCRRVGFQVVAFERLGLLALALNGILSVNFSRNRTCTITIGLFKGRLANGQYAIIVSVPV